MLFLQMFLIRTAYKTCRVSLFVRSTGTAQYNSLLEPKLAMLSEWCVISLLRGKNIIKSFQKLLLEVISVKGGTQNIKKNENFLKGYVTCFFSPFYIKDCFSPFYWILM